MRLRLVRQPFDHPDYIFELKHDGFRAIAYLQNGESKLVSRNQRNLGFEALKRSLAKLPVENAIIDGEGFAFVPDTPAIFRFRHAA
jgi:ATP-dependent DNA ligase